MEVLKAMTAREVLNLIEWLKSKNFTSDDIVDCIESVEGKKKKEKEDKEDQKRERNLPPLFFEKIFYNKRYRDIISQEWSKGCGSIC